MSTHIGIATTAAANSWLGFDAYGWSYGNVGSKYTNGSAASYAASYTTGDTIGIAFNADDRTLTFYKNGVNQGNAYSGLAASTYFFAISSNSPQGNWNFGQRPFAYTAPSGFKALCTQNLSTPTVVQGDDYFNTVLYTGTGSTQSITGVGFQPDFVWVKSRSAATDHGLYDAVRGVQKQLESNTTTDETTETTGLTAFGSDGFTVGSLAQVNTSSATYVAWQWKESVASGFDIVTYTGNGSNRTIAHNLGVAPSLIIVKARTTASTDQGWPTWHTSIANTNYLMLNTTAASTSGATYWNSTSPTSSVFSVGTDAAVNANGDTYVAYLFAAIPGFSAFGSYTGNGSADGPFVYTGFRPAFVMVKRTDSSEDWVMWD
ncbi:MAG: hypothetical protein EBS53_18720, partial [Bacteroidetes bacterium]|nr:hypothetical protein [Bacteroidota bacterium]